MCSTLFVLFYIKNITYTQKENNVANDVLPKIFFLLKHVFIEYHTNISTTSHGQHTPVYRTTFENSFHERCGKIISIFTSRLGWPNSRWLQFLILKNLYDLIYLDSNGTVYIYIYGVLIYLDSNVCMYIPVCMPVCLVHASSCPT